MCEESVVGHSSPQTKEDINYAGRYLYCLGDMGTELALGQIGLEKSEVYTIAYKDLCAVVHDCSSQPYDSRDQQVIEGWLLAHENTVETAWQKFGTVLPFSFDTIVKGQDSVDAEERLKSWLERNYEPLRDKIKDLRGKAEYVVQVFWDPKVAVQQLAALDEELRQLERKVTSRSGVRGRAYLQKQKLERVLKEEIKAQAEKFFNDFYGRIEKHTNRLQVEKTKRFDGKETIIKLACLVQNSKVEALENELKEIESLEGFSVRLTGPWPPYSFVGT